MIVSAGAFAAILKETGIFRVEPHLGAVRGGTTHLVPAGFLDMCRHVAAHENGFANRVRIGITAVIECGGRMPGSTQRGRVIRDAFLPEQPTVEKGKTEL